MEEDGAAGWDFKEGSHPHLRGEGTSPAGVCRWEPLREGKGEREGRKGREEDVWMDDMALCAALLRRGC